MLSAVDPAVLDEMEEPTEAGHSPRIVLWLVVVGLAGLFLPLYLVSAAIKGDNRSLKTDLASIEQQLSDLSQPGEEQQTLQDTLIKSRQQVNTLTAVQSDLNAHHINWPAVMAIIGNNGPVQMVLTGLSQAENRIVISGQAQAESVVMAYAHMLEESGQFSRVIVQSISLKALPTPTPLPTSTPASADTTLSTPAPAEPAQIVEFVILVELQPQEGGNE
jgi:Tfp pilus assembly protein PilN